MIRIRFNHMIHIIHCYQHENIKDISISPVVRYHCAKPDCSSFSISFKVYIMNCAKAIKVTCLE